MHTRSDNLVDCVIPIATSTFLHNTDTGTCTTLRDTVQRDHHYRPFIGFAKPNWVTSDLSVGSYHTVLAQLFVMTPHCLMRHWPSGAHSFAEI
jgi:hypothetical protein